MIDPDKITHKHVDEDPNADFYPEARTEIQEVLRRHKIPCALIAFTDGSGRCGISANGPSPMIIEFAQLIIESEKHWMKRESH